MPPLNLRLGFLGGYGHCAARVDLARPHLAEHGITLLDVPYPGFEGRPCPADLDTFLDGVAEALQAAQPEAIYATGLGGLLVLFLRKRGLARGPVLMQAPRLMGVPQSFHLKALHHPHAQHLLPRLLTSPRCLPLIAARYFRRWLTPLERQAFFRGLVQCHALHPLLRWLDADRMWELLRFFQLERGLLNEGVQVWWGGSDPLVSEFEMERSEDELRLNWPVELYDTWGHYPMLEDPVAWATEVARHFRGQPRQYAPLQVASAG